MIVLNTRSGLVLQITNGLSTFFVFVVVTHATWPLDHCKSSVSLYQWHYFSFVAVVAFICTYVFYICPQFSCRTKYTCTLSEYTETCTPLIYKHKFKPLKNTSLLVFFKSTSFWASEDSCTHTVYWYSHATPYALQDHSTYAFLTSVCVLVV